MRVDLHTHTNASDGALTPQALCERALAHDVELLAITDHDTCAGWREAEALARRPRLIAAAEFSCQWRNAAIHVVGLGFDPDHETSVAAFAQLQQSRVERAGIIGERLARLGFPDTCEDATALAGASQVGRPHFAQILVQRGVVASPTEAFDRYLGAGKPGDVKALWPDLAEVTAWIGRAGGVAVLAHPLKYKLTATRLKLLVAEFKAAGGGALEVITGRPQPGVIAPLVRLCQTFALEASVGSDFHQPGQFWAEVGEVAPLPTGCQPVWERWLN